MDFLTYATDFVVAYLKSLPFGFGLIAIFLLLERIAPAERGQSWRRMWFNVRYSLIAGFLGLALTTLLTALVVAKIRAAHPEWFGWIGQAGMGGLALYALAYYAVFDLLYYTYHRLQHTWPVLWRVHLLHHSETAVNATTTLRQHWLEEPVKVFFMTLPLALMFEEVPKVTGIALMALQVWAVFIHANIRLPLGPLGLVISGPQFHRLHHSCLKEHMDRNYAVFFPIFDVIFGSYTHPKPGEYPPTGLVDGSRIETVTGALLAPFRQPTGGPEA